MKEFGSDFHSIASSQLGQSHLTDVYRDYWLFADGRQCLVSLIRQEGWKRIWIPEYFCYEVIDAVIRMTGIDVVPYVDFPLEKQDQQIVKSLPFQDKDVLLRMNYFGIRDKRTEKEIPVPVIEDHSHDLSGHWALHSDADWCFASLRKSLPIAGGGILWSPKNISFRTKILETKQCQESMKKRWMAMDMKADYLRGAQINKNDFRQIYLETEEWFEDAEPSQIDIRSKELIGQLDINAWQGAKKKNWLLLRQLVNAETLLPEEESCTPFSFILIAKNAEARMRIKKRLIDNAVYPAILWNLPENTSNEALNFSHRMLSIHCDGRYSEDDIRKLATLINDSIEV